MISSKTVAVWQNGLPTVYYIFYDEYVYIGITQRLPFKRWNDHFSQIGSFVNAIKKHIPEYDFNAASVKIISITLDKVAIASTKELQALEKLLHIDFDSNPFVKDQGFMTISSTTCTAPRKFNYATMTNKAKALRAQVNELY